MLKRNTINRRRFLQACGAGIALSSPFAMSKSDPVLAMRQGAAPLLLNYNENSLGMSAKAVTAAQLATTSMGNRYPDDAVVEFRQALATRHGVSAEQIILGNGSTEVIQAIVTVAEGRGAKVIEPSPTFGDARRYANAEGLEIITVPVGSGFKTDIAAMRAKADKVNGPLLINICNPNNPTGTIVDQKALVEWVNEANAQHLFLIDEAYHDYALSNPNYQSILPLIKMGKENVVLCRTFSKIYGMAGMRIGYGIAAKATAKEVRKFAAGYNLSAAGTAAALASLEDQAFYNRSVQSNQKSKTILLDCLDELKLAHIPSNTNFVLHRINSSVSDYSARMASIGIKVGRRMTSEDGWNRISLGTPAEMQVFVAVLKEFRSQAWV